MEEKNILEEWILFKAQNLGKDYRSKDLARDSDVSEQFISQIRNGQRGIGLHSVQRFAKAFGVSISDFFLGPPKLIKQSTPIPIYDQRREQIRELSQEEHGSITQKKRQEEEEMPEIRLRGELMGILCELSGDDLRNVYRIARALRDESQQRHEKNQVITS